MKTLLLLAALVSSSAQAMPMPPNGNKLFDLMKCTSPKNGTIWASFGHAILSGEDKVRFFPTEIVLFGKDISARLLFPNFKEALKEDVDVGVGRMHMGFVAVAGDRVQKNLLQIMQYDKRIMNSYIGNWTVTEEGKPEIYDQVFCTLN